MKNWKMNLNHNHREKQPSRRQVQAALALFSGDADGRIDLFDEETRRGAGGADVIPDDKRGRGSLSGEQ